MSKSRRWQIILAIAAIMMATPIMVDAVLVAPHAVFIDHRTRTAQVNLVNTGTEPEEIDVDLTFGYPDTDSAGNVYVRLVDDPSTDAPSAAGWIRAFPRKLVLAPGARQVVRLLATPPRDLPDGEYWTRLIVTSRGGNVSIAGGDSAISAGLTLELRTIISVSYRKGDIHTGVSLTDLQVDVENDSLVAWVGLEREGNAAYLGQLTFDVLGEGDGVVASWPTPIAVYYPVHRRFAFSLDSVPAGSYTVNFRLDTDREDLERAVVLPADPIERSVGVEILR